MTSSTSLPSLRVEHGRGFVEHQHCRAAWRARRRYRRAASVRPKAGAGARMRRRCISTCSSAQSTRASISVRGMPRFSGPKATSSSTIVATIWLSGCWKTMPTVRADVAQALLVTRIASIHPHIAGCRAAAAR